MGPMSNTAPAAGIAPAVPAAPAPAPVAPVVEPTVESFRTALPKFSGAELDAMLAAAPAKPSVVAPAAPAAVTPPAATPEPVSPPAVVAPVTDPTKEEDTPDAQKLGRFRIEASNFKDAEVYRLIAKSQGEHRTDPAKPVLSLAEAYRQVYGEQTTPPASAPPKTETTPAPADPAATIKTEIAAKQAEIAALETKITTAAENMEVTAVSAHTRAISKIEREIERLEDRAKEVVANAQKSTEDAATAQFRAREKESTGAAIKEFPVLGDKNSAERKEFDAFVEAKSQDTDYEGIFSSSRWPIIIAREFAEAKGLKAAPSTATPPAAAAATPPANQTPPATPPAAPRVTAATVIQPGGDGSSGFAPTAESLKQEIATGKYSAKDLDRMLAGAPTR